MPARPVIGTMLALTAVAAALIAACAAAAQTPAAGPAAQRFMGWLAAFNSDDPSAIDAFTREAIPSMDAEPGQSAPMQARTGGFDLVAIEEESETALTALISPRARPGSYNRITFTVAAEPPHFVEGIQIALAAPPADPAAGAPDGDWRAAAMTEAAEILEANYVYADEGARIAAYLRGNKGAYAGVEDKAAFAAALTADLLKRFGDGHLRIDHGPPAPPSGPSGAPPYCMTADIQARMLEAGAGYIRLPRFGLAPDYLGAFDAAMADLAGAGALILDLRGNCGGAGAAMNHVASWFLEEGAVIVAQQMRGGPPQLSRAAAVAGPKYLDRPVYVLIDRETFSAGEAFAFAMSDVAGRAAIVGEATLGGGHFGGRVTVAGEFSLFVPSGRAFNPETDRGWQGTGVTPDIAVTADAALDAALEDFAARAPME